MFLTEGYQSKWIRIQGFQKESPTTTKYKSYIRTSLDDMKSIPSLSSKHCSNYVSMSYMHLFLHLLWVESHPTMIVEVILLFSCSYLNCSKKIMLGVTSLTQSSFLTWTWDQKLLKFKWMELVWMIWSEKK